MSKENNSEITFTNHQTFFAIAYQHHELVKRLMMERDKRKVKNDHDVDFICARNAAIQRSAMVSVVFSALTLEAFINNYAIEHFSKNYFENNLDKLSTVSKWIVIPKLVTGNEIDTDGQPYENLKKLFKLRDKLVHYKTRKKKISEMTEDKDWVTENHSEVSLLTLKSIFNELATVDSSVNTDWLEEAKCDPYA
ncbi:MAG: hypothetical protein ACTSR2_02175 [Candidatus Hodarchaeales archaeon]